MAGFNPPDDVPPLFRMNTGQDGYIFKERGKDKHPYFDIAKGDKENAKVNWGLPIPQPPKPAPIIETPKVFKPATTWEEAVKTMRESGIAYELDGLSKASLETLNTINKVLIETKSNENIFFDKIKIIKTQAKRQWIPAEHKITLAADGSVLDRTLTVNQGHIDWAINKYGSMENFMSKDNWFAVNSFEGVINHEVGHLVTIGNFNNKSEILEWQKLVSPKRINISGYGKTHGEEALAEIWAVYKVKGKDSLSSEFIDFFNTYSKKYKI
jgi:hypothetical protein